MLFFDKPNLVVYLKRNSLEIYKGSDKTADVTYPDNTVRFLEVINADVFEKFILGILPRSEGQKVTIVLSSDMVFQKIFPRNPKDEQQQIQSFLEKIPFASTQLEIKKIANEKEWAIVAITKNLYQPVKKILEKAGFSVTAVVPASIFGDVSPETPLNQKDVWSKVKDNKVIETGNFL